MHVNLSVVPSKLLRGMINSILTTIEFTIILWSLSGILSLFGLNIEKGVVFFIYAFIIPRNVNAQFGSVTL